MAWSKLGTDEPQRPLAAPSLSPLSLAGCRGEQGLRSVPACPSSCRNKDTTRDEFIFYSKRLMRLLIEHALSFLPLKVCQHPSPAALSLLRARGPQGPALPTLCSPPLSAVGYGGDAPRDDVRREAIPQAEGEMSWPSPPCGHAAAPCLVGTDWEIPLAPAWCRAAGLPGQPVPPSHGVGPSTIGLHGNCRASGEHLGPELGPWRHGRAGQRQAGRV